MLAPRPEERFKKAKYRLFLIAITLVNFRFQALFYSRSHFFLNHAAAEMPAPDFFSALKKGAGRTGLTV
jgi:hypothetical protein